MNQHDTTELFEQAFAKNVTHMRALETVAKFLNPPGTLDCGTVRILAFTAWEPGTPLRYSVVEI
jgi:hypothetical protein